MSGKYKNPNYQKEYQSKYKADRKEETKEYNKEYYKNFRKISNREQQISDTKTSIREDGGESDNI